MLVLRIWSSLLGLAGIIAGILKLFSIIDVSIIDSIIHAVSGIFFIGGAWIQNGKFVKQTNQWLGFFYSLYGALDFNWPHMIIGLISVIMSLLFKPYRSKTI